MVESPPAMRETQVGSLCREDPLEEGMATHSSVLAWRIPWREEPGRLQSLGLQRVGRDWAGNTFTFKLLVVEKRHCNCSPSSCPGAASGMSWASHWTSPGLTPLQLHMGVWWLLPRLSPGLNKDHQFKWKVDDDGFMLVSVLFSFWLSLEYMPSVEQGRFGSLGEIKMRMTGPHPPGHSSPRDRSGHIGNYPCGQKWNKSSVEMEAVRGTITWQQGFPMKKEGFLGRRSSWRVSIGRLLWLTVTQWFGNQGTRPGCSWPRLIPCGQLHLGSSPIHLNGLSCFWWNWSWRGESGRCLWSAWERCRESQGWSLPLWWWQVS